MRKNCLRICITLLVLLIFALGCSTLPPLPGGRKQLVSFGRKKVVICEPLVLRDVFGIEDDEKAYELNLFIGNIEFSGGVITDKDRGMMTLSKNSVFNRQEQYTEQAVSMVRRIITSAAETKKYSFSVVNGETLVSAARETGFTAIALEKDYSKHDEDGKDNINLPWMNLLISDLSSDFTSVLKQKTGADYLMVPVILRYYSHSAGWFNDQWAGCGAGIRLSTGIYIFDLATGKKVFNSETTLKYVEEFSSRISEFLLAQKFNDLEKLLEKRLLKIVPRG